MNTRYMMRERLHKTIRSGALAVGLLAVLQGCVLDHYDENDDPMFSLSLTVVSGLTDQTRARHEDSMEQPGSAAENYVDFPGGDFRTVLFDNAGNYLFAIDDSGKWTIRPYDAGSDFAVYQLECEVEFPKTVTKSTIDQVKAAGFQVMVLANWQNSRTAGYDNLFTPGASPQNLAAVWKDGDHYNFPYRAGTGGLTWMPAHEGTSRQLIPMFGYARAARSESAAGSGYHFVSTVKLQRALAKIEVIDDLVNQPALCVSDVTMNDYNTSGRFIPDVAANPYWDMIGEQVNASSLPAGVASAGSVLKFFRTGGTANAGGKWIAYVPEMALDKLTLAADKSFDPESDAAKNRTHLDISIATKENESIPGYTGGTYIAHFAKYLQNVTPTIPDDSWNHILRNHIYRFEVKKVGFTVNLHLHVIPWDKDEDEVWDYTDQVTIQRILLWEEYPDPDGKTDEDGNILNVPSYESCNAETGEVVLWLDPKRPPLKGSFKITTPVNGRWYVRLIPIDGSKTDAVTFVDVDQDGKAIPLPEGSAPRLEISGSVNNGQFPDYFYIMPTNFDNDFESRYRLEFYVENLGIWTEVPMTPDNFRYYTIVRQRNLIVE